jgi:fatty-acyl-CoA synthase
MMGAVLQTVNVRLSPEQILYTLNHAKADIVVLVNVEFHPDAGDHQGPARNGEALHPDQRRWRDNEQLQGALRRRVRGPAGCGVGRLRLPRFRRNTRATTFYTTGTTGLPKGVYFSHRQLVLHTLGVATASAARRAGPLHRDDVYMPITPMFHVHAWGMPYVATMLGLKQVYPGRYVPDTLLQLIADEASPSRIACRPSCTCC